MSKLKKIFDDNYLYSPKQIYIHLEVSKDTIYNALTSGDLSAYRVGKVWRIPGYSINDYLLRD